MPDKILIIDDSIFHRRLLERLILSQNKQAHIDTYDPVTMGLPSHDFCWSDYDVIVMDYNLNNGTALDWLYHYGKRPGFPPTIIVTGEGNESIAVKAIKFGASDYLTKDNLNASEFNRSIMEAMQTDLNNELGFDENALPDKSDTFLEKESTGQSNPENWPFTLEDIFGGNAIVQHYRILGYIGKGGMGTVFKAKHDQHDELVAIKLIHREMTHDPKVKQRFIREYQAIENIQHPGIVKVYAQDFTDNHAYIVMEYLPAGHLRNVILRGIKLSDALNYAKQIISALGALHAHGIIHRDLKPLNVIFRETHQPVLVDFGVAKNLAVTDDGLTTIGRSIGTPVYSSPEQICGQTLDHRSDLYSFGVLFYEMLTGKKLFTSKNMTAMIMKHIKEAPPELPDKLFQLHPIMHRLLAKKPENRYESAELVLEDLEKVSF